MAKRAGKNPPPPPSPPPSRASGPFRAWAYAKNAAGIFIASLRQLNWRIPVIALLDFLFYFGAYVAIMIARKFVQAKEAALPFPETPDQLTAEQAALLLTQSKAFLFTFIGIIIAVALCIIILWSILKGIIWAMTLRQRYTPALAWRFLVLGFGWLGPWVALILFFAYISNALDARPFFLALFVVFIITGNSILAFYTRSPGWPAVKKGLSLAFTSVHLLILPYLALFVIYILFGTLFGLLPRVVSCTAGVLAAQVAWVVFALLFITISRAYVAHLVIAIDEEKL